MLATTKTELKEYSHNMFDIYELKTISLALEIASKTIEINMPDDPDSRATAMLDKFAVLKAQIASEIDKQSKLNVTIKQQ
jgi:hypothetical protein